MRPLRVVLLPSDDSPCAESARAAAESIASHFEAELHELFVATVSDAATEWEWPVDVGLPTPETVEVGSATVPTIHAVRISDSPARGILNYAREIGADLIVMGTHGRDGVERMVRGSTSEYVLRRAQCPVLLVPPDAADSAAGRGRVLVAHDFSSPAAGALAAASRMAAGLGLPLDVLHVVEVTYVSSPFGPVTAAVDYEALRGRAERLLQAVAAPDDADAPRARIAARIGNPVDQIIAFARETGAGLIVVGSHGRRGVGRLFLGSVSEGIARRAPCPVLIVRGAPAAEEAVRTAAVPAAVPVA